MLSFQPPSPELEPRWKCSPLMVTRLMLWITPRERRWSRREGERAELCLLSAQLAQVLLCSVMLESARIARGAVKPLNQLTVDGADAVVIPGGFGAAKNLSDFGFKVSWRVVTSDLTVLTGIIF